MRFTPNKETGGRIAEGDTAWGYYYVEWDADGNIINQRIVLKTPPESDKPKAQPKHPPDDEPRSYRPGDVLKWIIERRLGYKLTCAECGKWRRWMNDEGWAKCLTVHRKAILERIEQQAAEYGIDYDGVAAELWKCATGSSGAKDE